MSVPGWATHVIQCGQNKHTKTATQSNIEKLVTQQNESAHLEQISPPWPQAAHNYLQHTEQVAEHVAIDSSTPLASDDDDNN